VHVGNGFNDTLAGKASSGPVHRPEDGAGVDNFIIVMGVVYTQ